MLSNTEILEKQNIIICMQADIIDSMFALLMQYIDIEDIENLECMDKMQDVSELYREIDI